MNLKMLYLSIVQILNSTNLLYENGNLSMEIICMFTKENKIFNNFKIQTMYNVQL